MTRPSRILSSSVLAVMIVLALAMMNDSRVLSFQTSSLQHTTSSSWSSLSFASLRQHRTGEQPVIPLHRTTPRVTTLVTTTSSSTWRRPSAALYIFGPKSGGDDNVETRTTTAEETAEKYGLEAGLFQSLKSDNTGATAKSLLAKYGVAYLATSIPLALLSFAICYTLVDNGVDVAGLLAKVGINNVGDAGEKAGTFAIAYAAHKAASPIRFPPTVLLTPLVARLIGKEEVLDEDSSE